MQPQATPTAALVDPELVAILHDTVTDPAGRIVARTIDTLDLDVRDQARVVSVALEETDGTRWLIERDLGVWENRPAAS